MEIDTTIQSMEEEEEEQWHTHSAKVAWHLSVARHWDEVCEHARW
jgi:hypothetical protein